MAIARLIGCLFLAATGAASSRSLLQRGASRHRSSSFAGLLFSPQDPAARTLLTLDTNHDGRIDPSEVAAFAEAQGLDASAATQEFSSIDVNRDGVLDSIELRQVFGESGPAVSMQTTPAQVAPVSLRRAPLLEDKEDFVVEPPVVQQTAFVEAVEPPLVPAAPALPAAPTAPMAATVSAPAAASALESAQLISAESRTSMIAAANEVVEELALEESEEREARTLDRKAAEIRANAASIAKLTAKDALDAGAKAAHAKTNDLMKKLSDLEDQAERAEVRAAALRAKSKMEMEEGNQLMAAADEALSSLPAPDA